MKYLYVIARASIVSCALGASCVSSAQSGDNNPLTHLVPAGTVGEAIALRDQAMGGSRAFEWVEALTTEVGPRLAGSSGEARARDWAVKKLTSLGFENVRVEPFSIDGWERGVE